MLFDRSRPRCMQHSPCHVKALYSCASNRLRGLSCARWHGLDVCARAASPFIVTRRQPSMLAHTRDHRSIRPYSSLSNCSRSSDCGIMPGSGEPPPEQEGQLDAKRSSRDKPRVPRSDTEDTLLIGVPSNTSLAVVSTEESVSDGEVRRQPRLRAAK